MHHHTHGIFYILRQLWDFGTSIAAGALGIFIFFGAIALFVAIVRIFVWIAQAPDIGHVFLRTLGAIATFIVMALVLAWARS